MNSSTKNTSRRSARKIYPYALIHTTSILNAIRIIRSGSLKTLIELGASGKAASGYTVSKRPYTGNHCAGQYPGAYMGVMYEKDNIVWYGEDEVAFIFYVDLIDRMDYHYNNTDQNGFISSSTLSSEEYIKKLNSNMISPSELNEIVFHNEVSTEMISEIVVQYDKQKDFLSTLIDKPIIVSDTVSGQYFSGRNIKAKETQFCGCIGEREITDDFRKILSRRCGFKKTVSSEDIDRAAIKIYSTRYEKAKANRKSKHKQRKSTEPKQILNFTDAGKLRCLKIAVSTKKQCKRSVISGSNYCAQHGK